MKKKINIVTLGCSKNLVDSEVLMRQLMKDYSIVHDSNDKADIIVIVTCGFVHDAKEESVDTILRAVQFKINGDTEKVIVTGCLSERYKKELSSEIKEVDGFFGVNELPEVLSALNVNYKKELIGERLLTTPSHYAYLKISEGCNRNCSFCVIPLIRGKHVSKPKEDIINEARFLAKQGVKEVILIAQDLTWYGIDIYNKRELPDLLKRISEVEGIEWIRLHYTYPANFPAGLIKVMVENPKICSYMDMPLQHISSRILRSMKRGLGGQKTKELVKKIKKAIPDVAMRTTLIVGYPGETEEEFEQLMDFVKQTRFERLGVFTYSHEEETSAYSLKDNVPKEIKEDRRDQLMMLQQEISYELNKQKVDTVMKVIIDKKEGDNFIGRTEFDSPEVDNEVIIQSSNSPLLIGEYYNVKITSADFFDLYGEVEV
ncbi:MAG: 30S ribosomal protein S12 methylthiotransferase RimO [Bacteroidetes bacterium]|nr:30S ribosomal protein S12 methylthiotransferase RimO [Bacteroidota bacterium]MBL6943770.1 30S ribosomal protein S12 methylthiotransferase RimO [Bacteroidales bacterium]